MKAKQVYVHTMAVNGK